MAKDLSPFSIVMPGVAVQIVLEVFEEDGRTVCGIKQLDGHIDLPPRAWLAAVRGQVGTIEKIASNAGCEELRIAGRDWSKILPDFEPFDGPRNGLRKVL